MILPAAHPDPYPALTLCYPQPGMMPTSPAVIPRTHSALFPGLVNSTEVLFF